jgi:hypothetical protein
MLSTVIAQTDSSSDGGGLWAVFLVGLVWFVIVVAGWWKTFEKAGQPGWKAIIPIYNAYIILKIIGRPGWWLLLYFVPIVNLIVWIIALHGLSKSYGRGVGFTIGLIFLMPIFALILGFGSSRYLGPSAGPAATS